jgi:predicted neuraminidase
MKLLLALLFPLLVAADEPVRTWQGIPGIERSPKGRIFVAWYSGGTKEPASENFVVLKYSDDNGSTFTKPEVVAGPKAGSRAFDPTLWIDPAGRLWYIFNRGNRETAEHAVYARICEKPDAQTPRFGEEFRLEMGPVPYAFRMNKPIVLKSGEWVLPVTHAAKPSHEWFAQAEQVQGVAISSDKGRSWKLHGSLHAPHWALENMIVELKDRRLWMLIRTGSGVLWQSHSSDRGRTWTEASATTIANPGSRFFVRRLRSGSLLLVNHHHFQGRSHLTAQVSRDEGKTWNEGLLLDERSGVSYPDAVEAKDGTISVIYDRDRKGAGEILMAQFREADVVAGKGAGRLKHLVDHLAPWDPKGAADRVMSRLVTVTGPEVKGAHDAEFVIVDGKAYIVAMANEVQPGESAEWPFVYCTMSVVSLRTMQVEKRIPVARGGQVYANFTLPEGACFVPRILRKDDSTLRVFFASEMPKQRQAQMHYLDFDLKAQVFRPEIHRARIKTSTGTFDMQPVRFFEDAAAQGFRPEAKDYGLYNIDGFKNFDGKVYAVVNNFAGGQNGLAVLNEAKDTFEVLGHFNSLTGEKLTESAVNRMPDGSWLAICRQDGGSRNYMFSTSRDGRNWTAPAYWDAVANGTNSKPNLEKFGNTYYLGWQEATRVNNVSRSVFNIDVSTDGKTWARKYRFESDKSFQYLSLHEYRGEVFVTVTQGDNSPSRKERILFGKLE